MKRGLIILLLISFLVLPAIGLAATPPEIRPAPRISLLIALDRTVDVLFTVLMAVAVIFIIIGAFQFVTAGGNSEAVNAARDKILYAVIAVVVAFLARGIVMFLEGAFLTPSPTP